MSFSSDAGARETPDTWAVERSRGDDGKGNLTKLPFPCSESRRKGELPAQ